MVRPPMMAIITPCSRPENLQVMLRAVSTGIAPHFRVDWRIVFDADELAVPMQKVYGALQDYINVGAKFTAHIGAGVSGNPQRNEALDCLDFADFVYFLDDDNIPFGPMFKFVRDHGDLSSAYVFAQMWPNRTGRLLASPERMKPQQVDTAQFVLPYSFVGDTRWAPHDYCADGQFFTEIYSRHKDCFVFNNKFWCWYNYLR